MDDLISRQAAITLPVIPKEHREYQTFNLDDAYEQGWDDLQKCIEALPSAQFQEWNREHYEGRLLVLPTVKTNADKIRQMSDEELASFMEGLSPSKEWSIFLDGKRWLDWLKQEVKDDPNEART